MGAQIKESSMNFVKILRLLVNNKPKKQLKTTFDSMKDTPVICYDWLKAKIAERKF
jgi:hypothetical protein